MFLGHSDCGAIKAYLKGFDKETYGIKHELDFLRPVIKDHRNDFDFDKLHDHVIEKNLDYQVNIAYKKYKDLINAGELTVMAGFYDFRGEFGKGLGTIVIVNVNKHKGINELYPIPSSLAGLIPGGLTTSYSASKHAVVGFSLTLRSEAKLYGIKVIN